MTNYLLSQYWLNNSEIQNASATYNLMTLDELTELFSVVCVSCTVLLRGNVALAHKYVSSKQHHLIEFCVLAQEKKALGGCPPWKARRTSTFSGGRR